MLRQIPSPVAGAAEVMPRRDRDRDAGIGVLVRAARIGRGRPSADRQEVPFPRDSTDARLTGGVGRFWTLGHFQCMSSKAPYTLVNE